MSFCNFLALLFFLWSFPEIFAIEKRLTPLSLTTSVIIPCHQKHAKHLPELVMSFTKQTVLPDEIIISLSDYKKVDPSVLEKIASSDYPFSVTLLQFENALSAGKNRNRACAEAIGDILICHDADDLSHPQRIAIIKYFFENFVVDHLVHT